MSWYFEQFDQHLKGSYAGLTFVSPYVIASLRLIGFLVAPCHQQCVWAGIIIATPSLPPSRPAGVFAI